MLDQSFMYLEPNGIEVVLEYLYILQNGTASSLIIKFDRNKLSTIHATSSYQYKFLALLKAPSSFETYNGSKCTKGTSPNLLCRERDEVQPIKRGRM